MSPEQLGNHILAITHAPTQAAKPLWIEIIDAIGAFFDRAGWPFVVLLALILFRKPLSNITEFRWGDRVSVKIANELKQVGENAPITAKAAPPTKEEVAKSGEIERLASKVDREQVRRAAVDLAVEYEQVRSGASASHERTRRMEVVMSKMRALGRAVIPFRYELRASASPGQRLMAIASYQVAPDYDALEWLVERVRVEKPFVGYHAAVALLGAAQDGGAGAHLKDLKAAATASKTLSPGPGTDREVTIQAFRTQVQLLEKQFPKDSAEPSRE